MKKDRSILPGESDGIPDDLNRRRFLEFSVGSLLALGVAAITPPLIVSFIGPSFTTNLGDLTKVGSLGTLKPGQPTNLGFTATSTDAYLSETQMHSVWVVKGAKDELSVFSPICPHLGCQYNWNEGAKQFQCPCHGSVFATDGTVLGGPAPRPLDTLPHQVTDGDLYVKWERFKVGIPQKVQA